MTTNKAAIRWCAVYTRKSSEEGLEQQFNSLTQFNSLHAQREAEAYIKSQRHERWCLLEEKYDHGGYSGGNLERPALIDGCHAPPWGPPAARISDFNDVPIAAAIIASSITGQPGALNKRRAGWVVPP